MQHLGGSHGKCRDCVPDRREPRLQSGFEARTFDLQSDTFEAVFNAFEGFCVAVYIWPRSVQACQVCCSKNRNVGYLLTCCRSVVSGTLLGAITSAGRFIGKEVS